MVVHLCRLPYSQLELEKRPGRQPIRAEEVTDGDADTRVQLRTSGRSGSGGADRLRLDLHCRKTEGATLNQEQGAREQQQVHFLSASEARIHNR